MKNFRHKLCLLIFPLFLLAELTGCATVGFIPDNVAHNENNNYEPSLNDARVWAYKVADGYDSRASMNRYASYAGGTIATLALGALTGLATFSTGHSWILGLPIFGATTGGLISLYQNEDKARIYRLGNEYIKDLLTISNKRVLKSADEILKRANKGLTDAQQTQTNIKQLSQTAANDLNSAVSAATTAKASADAAPSNAALAQAAAKAALDRDARQKTVDGYRLDLALAKNDVEAAIARQKNAVQRATLSDEYQNKFEATCLIDDVNSVMRKIDEHIALLDPQNAAKLLQSLSSKSATISIQDPLKLDFSDLSPPVKSGC